METIDESLHLGSAGITPLPLKTPVANDRIFFSDIDFYQSDKVIGEKFFKPISKILAFDI